jgi:hypothetical protein
MERALASMSAQISILKPGGSLTLSIGMSLAGIGAGGCAWGASGEDACSGERPCAYGGGDCCCASSGDVALSPRTTTALIALAATWRMLRGFDRNCAIAIVPPF